MAGMTDSVGAAGGATGGGNMTGMVGTGMQLLGTIFDAQSKKKAGNQFRDTSEFTARQYDIEAGQAIAGAQRQALEQRRRATLTQSRALALAAASGGASSPGVIDLIADIEGEGNYRAMTAMYEGESAARQYRMSAAARRYEGAMAKQAGDSAMLPAILRGGATLFSRYGGDGPPGINNSALTKGLTGLAGEFNDFQMDGQE